jgi:pyruvate dehydrogenase E2 component (dihydrolipoamide acetyltransferase)
MEFKLPSLGENVKEAEVLNVLVKKGDRVQKDQPVLEMESEKATFEVPAPQSGTVSEVHVAKGAQVSVGQTILTLEEGKAEARPEPEKKEATGEAKEEAPAPPSEAGKGEEPKREEKPEAKAARPEPEKKEAKKQAKEEASARPSEAAKAEEPKREEKPDAKAAPPEPAKPPEPREEAAAKERPEPAEEDSKAAAGPATRRLARELGVDLTQVRGTEAGGRITTEDVKRYVRERAAGGGQAEAAEAPDFERWGAVERRPLTAIQKTAARRLSQSWRGIPHVTHHDLADVTELEKARERYESGRQPSEPKLTVTALVVKAVVASLRAFPQCNASLDLAREEVVLKRYVHVGVAVDTEHGLLVPVVRDADRKTTREIAADLARLAERARHRKLAPEEMQGASFTVTNLGGIGGIAFTPIVSSPEVAILGLSRTHEELALRSGQVVPRLVLPLSLSYDHRAVNGADAARFVRHLAGLLEDPIHLLTES